LEALLLLVLLYLPGHFLGRRLVGKGDGRAETVLLRLSVSAAVATPLLVLLAIAGWFTVPVVAASLAVCSCGAWALGCGCNRSSPASRWDFRALVLVAGSLALYARPAEYVINSRDPGVYTVFADRLARTGELLKYDPLVDAVSGFHTFVEGIKYPGFYISGGDQIVPQFFPGPFAWLGFGNLVGGLWGSLYVVPVFGALSVGAAFLLGGELFGRWAGLLGGALLAVSYTQVWWSRHPSSEVMTQFFVLSGLWLAVRFLRNEEPVTGVMAGVLLGGAMLVRVDGFLAAAAIPALFGYDLLLRRPVRRWLLPGIPLAVFAGASLLYLNTVGGRYLYLIYSEHGLGRALGYVPYAVVTAAVILTAFWFVRRRWGARLAGWLEVHGRDLSLLGAIWIAGLVLWAYFVLPLPPESLPIGSRELDAYRTQVLVRMVWFTTPPVALLGLAGFLLAARRLDTGRALLLGTFLAFGALYTAIPNVAPDLPWATRRFVPAAFPVLSLLAGYAVVEAGRLLGRLRDRPAGMELGVGLAILALGWTLYTASPVLGVREYEGAIAAFDRLDEQIPAAEVVYVEKPDGHDGSVSTLEYVYGRPTLPYSAERFREEVDELKEAGLLDDAVYVTTDGGPAPLISGVQFDEVAREELDLPQLDDREGHERGVPRGMANLHLTFRIYEVEAVER
jgi:hypothetical protein